MTLLTNFQKYLEEAETKYEILELRRPADSGQRLLMGVRLAKMRPVGANRVIKATVLRYAVGRSYTYILALIPANHYVKFNRLRNIWVIDEDDESTPLIPVDAQKTLGFVDERRDDKNRRLLLLPNLYQWNAGEDESFDETANDIEQGAIPAVPYGCSQPLTVLVSKTLPKMGYVYFKAGSQTKLITMKAKDYRKILAGLPGKTAMYYADISARPTRRPHHH
jgi:prolyl-tRNA editing enzyme YbaK/EbsC (Cys-tRNA(Pro) deacylase)